MHKGSSTPTDMSKINSRKIQSNIENFNKIHALSVSVRIGPVSDTPGALD